MSSQLDYSIRFEHCLEVKKGPLDANWYGINTGIHSWSG